MAKKKAKAKSKPVKAKNAKAKSKKAKSKKAKPSKKAKAKKVKAKSKPKAKKTFAKSKSKTSKKAVKKAVPKKKSAKKVAKKVSKPAVKKKLATKKTAVKKSAAKKSAPAKTVKVTAPVVAGNVVSENHAFIAHTTSLREGMMAPYFEGVDQNGNTVRSSELTGKTIILYFYPKDDTPGCTAESCSLRDEFFYLNNNNYSVIGVSADDVESHRRFADKFSLPFPLIADTNRSIINAYDVWGPKQVAGNIYDGIVRTTFVIDADGIIKNVVTKVDTENHAKQLLEL